MKSSVLTTFYVLLISTFCYSQNTVWTGNADSLWNNAANWNSGIPDLTKTAVIASTATKPYLNGTGNAQKIIIQNGATLTINYGGELVVDGSNTIPQPLVDVQNGGNLENLGYLNVKQSVGLGIRIQSGGVFTNFASGGTVLDSTVNDPLRNEGTFYNFGYLRINTFIASMNEGLANGPHGILNASNALLENYGEIEIINGQAPNGSSIRNSGTFNNNECGLIKVANSLKNSAGSTGPFTNDGLIQSSYNQANLNTNAMGFINNGILANVNGTFANSATFFGGNDVTGSGEYRTDDSEIGFCLDFSTDLYIENACACENPLNQYDPQNPDVFYFQEYIIFSNVPEGVVPTINGNNDLPIYDEEGNLIPVADAQLDMN